MKAISLPVHLKDKSTRFIEAELGVKIMYRGGSVAFVGEKVKEVIKKLV